MILQILLVCLLKLAIAGNPETKANKFDSLPSKMVYFDQDKAILLQEGLNIWHSKDKGESWRKVDNVPTESVFLLDHPYESKTAYIFSKRKVLISSDEGSTWTALEFPLELATLSKGNFAFNVKAPSNIIFQLRKCDSGNCRNDAYYTTDSFRTYKLLLPWTGQCLWAQSINAKLSGVNNKIFCSQWPLSEQNGDIYRKDPTRLQLFYSSDFFASKFSVTLAGGIPVLGLSPNWLVGVTKSSTGFQIVTCKDGEKFVQGAFNNLNQDSSSVAFSVLESSNNTLAVDVVNARPGTLFPLPFGTLYISNSNGNYFKVSLEHTNRDLSTGMVDFERIQGSIYDGVMLANIVKNWEAILNRREIVKVITSVMSFDNGRTWHDIIPPMESGCSGCTLHLHSVTTTKNIGKVFSISSAPGIVVGVGSVGDSLAPYEESHTFISHDSGRSWKKIMEGPHKFELLNYGSVIVLIPDGILPTRTIKYSTNGGSTFKSLEIVVEEADWLPLYSNLDKESRSLNMLLVVSKKDSRGSKFVIRLDFSKIFDRECNGQLIETNKDLELYQLHSPDSMCVLGNKVSHYRKKADVQCSMPPNFSLLAINFSPCPCDIHDFECDNGYAPNPKRNEECLPNVNVKDQPLDCKLGSNYLGSSGYSKIPGDKCISGKDYAAKIEKACKAGAGAPPADPVSHAVLIDEQIMQILHVKESSISVILYRNGSVSMSADEGLSWSNVVIPGNERIKRIFPHEVKFDRIFLISTNSIFISDDGLKSGKSGITRINAPELYNGLGIPIMDFHPTSPDYLILITGGRDCSKISNCHSTSWISLDGGKSFKKVDTWVSKCVWALDKEFNIPSLAKEAVFCNSYLYKDGRFGGQNLPQDPTKNPSYLKLYFSNGNDSVIVLDTNVIEFFVVGKVMIVATNEPSDPILFSSIDGQKFEKCSFPPGTRLRKSAFTLLPAHGEGVFIDIIQSSKKDFEYGLLYKSTLNGQTFSISEKINTNRAASGKVDFISIPGIDGVDIINVVSNAEMAGTGERKQIQSRITFNSGAFWLELKGPLKDIHDRNLCEKTDWCQLHIHLPSTSPAYLQQPFGGSAGLILAVGNIGESLGDYNSGDVFLTRDAGQTWRHVKEGPHIWAMADNGGLLVLVDGSKAVTTLSYSWDFGFTWADFQFHSNPVKVSSIFAHEGSSKVFLAGQIVSDFFTGVAPKFIYVQIDFSSLFQRPCDIRKEDFEIWSPAEPAESGKDRCFLGEVSQFLRRKRDAMCRIGPSFTSKTEEKKFCACSAIDFECDSGVFRNSAGKCEFVGSHPDQPEHCVKGQKFLGKSGYRKISLSKCTGGVKLEVPAYFECEPEPSGPENVKLFATIFDKKIVDYFYFEHSGSILLKDDGQRAYLSSNEGQSWSQILVDAGEIIALYNDPFIMGKAFVVTKSLLWITNNKGVDFYPFSIPNTPNLALSDNFLETHPTNSEWLIWIGSVNCPGNSCHSVASVTWDGGKNWGNLVSYVRTCKWAWSVAYSLVPDKTILCSQYNAQSGDQTYAQGMKLIVSTHGNSNFATLIDINGFALESEYLIAAVPNGNAMVQLQVSLDGIKFTTATLPDHISVRDGYTVLPSTTGSVFLNVIQSISPGAEYGTIVKSNWNGTFYHIAVDGVNQNRMGYVDFEKIEGLNGTMIVNQIRNIDDVRQGQNKQLVTKMTFDDGTTWNYLKPPKYDSEKSKYRCRQNCNLHLHAYTERRDKKDSYSSPGAAGVMIGVGNVGEYLEDYGAGDTFLSRDAGRSWIEISKQAHMIEINDHGAIILLANDKNFVTSVKYSLDIGATFREAELKVLEGQSIRIQNIITEPTGTTKHFVVIGTLKNGSTAAVTLDFDHVFSRICEVNEESKLSDFEEWTPNTNDSCTFGAKTRFLRRKIGRDCFVGDMYQKLEPMLSPCACTLEDYECDQYHVLNGENKCVKSDLVEMPEPQCRNGIKFISTGYIRKKISHCEGGLLLAPVSSACSVSSSTSWALIIFVFLPLTLFALYLLFRFIRGDLGRYGYISLQLDNETPLSTSGRFLAIIQDSMLTFYNYFAVLCSRGSEFVQSRVQRANGYVPVSTSTHYFDPNSPISSSQDDL